MSNITDSIRDYVTNMDPDMKDTIKRSLMGAAAGGMAMGGYKALTHKPHDADESRVKPVVNSALMGALLGGVVGGGLPTGLKMLSPSVDIPGMDTRKNSPIVNIGDWATSKVMANPGTSIGAGLGLGAIAREATTPGGLPRGVGGVLGIIKDVIAKRSVTGAAPLLKPLLFAGIGHMVDRTLKGKV